MSTPTRHPLASRPHRRPPPVAACAAVAMLLCPALAIAAAAAAPRQSLRLSPSCVQLPAPPRAASAAVAGYLGAARQAVRDVYLRGAHDTAAIARLARELDTNDALAELRPSWNDILITTAARALAQARLAPTLAALAQSARGARLARDGTVHNLEPASCARALAEPMAQAPGAMSMVVVVAPAGPQPLSAWRDACRASAASVDRSGRLARGLPKRPRRR